MKQNTDQRSNQSSASGPAVHRRSLGLEVRRGDLVKGDYDVQIGTAIATFDNYGKYADQPVGNHAAIYMGQDAQGIMVIDQWNNRRNGAIVGKQAPHIHMLLFDDKRPYVDNGNNFYVVE